MSKNSEVLVKVEGVSKKFCRDLKRSLWYGVKDISAELIGSKKNGQLRPKEFWAVDNVSFELHRGECLGLIGHNGAGKSTLLKMLNGLIKPDKGEITMKGRIGALIELGAGFNPILTGRENIYNNGAVLGFSKKEIDTKFDAIVEFAEIADFIDMPVQNYSSGMRVRLGFAVAAQMEPDVLIIDEVLAVGDMGFRIKCINEIQRMLSKAAVIFVTHSMPFVSRICNKGLLMNHGNDELQTDNIGDLIERYMAKFKTGERTIIGEKEVEIDNVMIYPSNSESLVSNSIPHGTEVNVSFELKVRSKYKYYIIRIVFFNLEQRPVLDFYSKQTEQIFMNKKSTVKMIVTAPHLYLNPGKYSLSIIVITDDQRKVLGRMDNASEFLVYSNYVSWAESYQPAKWDQVDLRD
ncbi:MAG: ABC transporter ATP-binding protein [Cytophagales bacterium]|nr:ABC transporter ATP-binding protein [Cytophagales bacterium]